MNNQKPYIPMAVHLSVHVTDISNIQDSKKNFFLFFNLFSGVLAGVGSKKPFSLCQSVMYKEYIII